jgi:hypothetical protein
MLLKHTNERNRIEYRKIKILQIGKEIAFQLYLDCRRNAIFTIFIPVIFEFFF